MINKEGKLYKFSRLLLLVSIVIALVVTMNLAISATHTSTADLTPEWSIPSTINDYEVEISNTGGDSIDEIRIMQNPEYTNLACENKADWTLVFVNNFPDPEFGNIDICWYFTDDAHAISAGNSQMFNFNATAPE